MTMTHPHEGLSADERFDMKTQPEPNTGCVLWLAATSAQGYGSFWDGARLVGAHRWNFERKRGPVPPGLVLDHVVCDTPSCVNEWHVEPRTSGQNTLRSSVAVAARYARRTHCSRGHRLGGNNIVPGTPRCCQACKLAHMRRFEQRRVRGKRRR